MRTLSTVTIAAIASWALAAAGCDSASQRQAFDEYQKFKAIDRLPPENRLADKNHPPGLTDQSTLNDYLAYAALNNAGLEASFNRWQAALEEIPQARSLPDPQFTFRWFVVPQAMRDGDMRFEYELAQTFPWLGKLELKGDMAALEAQAARRRFEADRLAVFSKVKQAYFEYAYLLRAIAISKENLQSLQSIESIALEKYKTGAGGQSDVIRAQVEVGKMENDLASMQDMLKPTAARLNAALNRPVDVPLPASMPAVPDAPAMDENQLLARVTKANPELAAMDLDVARQVKAVELAGKDYYPDFMLGVSYGQMESVSGLDMSPENPIAIMASVNIPIWWEKYAAGVRQAQARRQAAIKDKSQKANDLAAELKMETFSYRNAQRRVSLYRDTLIPKAQQAIKSTQAAYQTGTASFSDFVDTQRTLLEFQLNYERAQADARQALARIDVIANR